MTVQQPTQGGQNVVATLLKPGEQTTCVLNAGHSPQSIIAAAWVDYSIGDGNAPSAEELKLLQVAFLVDQNPIRNPTTGQYLQGAQQAMPACGVRRQLSCVQMMVVVKLDIASTRPMAVRVHAGYGLEGAESQNLTEAIETTVDEDTYTFYSIPRFATKWRAWDWAGGNELDFRDLALNVAGLPQQVQASQHPQWCPLPPAAGLILQRSVGGCVIQFGRD